MNKMNNNFKKTLADLLVAHQLQLEQNYFKGLSFKDLGHYFKLK